MAMFIPVIIAGGAAALGVTTGVAAFLTVGGAVLQAAGTFMGDKNLSKFGMAMGLIGGVAGIANASANAAAQAGAQTASAGNMAADAAAGSGTFLDGYAGAAGNAVETAGTGAADQLASAASGGVSDAAVQAGGQMEGGLSLAQQAQQSQSLAQGAQGSLGGAMDGYAGATGPEAAMDSVAKAAQATPSQSFDSWMQKTFGRAGQALSDAGKWAQKNPELVKLAGGAVSGAFGPDAQRLEMQQSLMERAQRNLAQPVVLSRYQQPAPSRG